MAALIPTNRVHKNRRRHSLAWPTSIRPSLLFLSLILSLGMVSSASATPVTLADLVNSQGEIESLDGNIEFEDFSAGLEGAPQSALQLFSVVPIASGFRLELAPGHGLASGTELILAYEVESEDAHASDLIRSMAVEVVGTSFFSAGMIAFGEDDDYRPYLGLVDASLESGEPTFDEVNLAMPAHEIFIIARLVIGDDAGGGTEMNFSSQPIPEPSTALLLSLGLSGFAVFQRSKRVQRSKRAQP
ncbi:MAG: PEP-CTERM sorting domain-containing protein [Myxococcota bacterium]|nr:PEP-CTERM sorting domain-containing protein [Myxococcota bacterium]